MTEYRDFLKGLEKGGLLNMFLVSLISSDNLLSVEDCEETLKEIDFCLEVLSENNLENEDKIRDILIQSKEVVIRDLKHFKYGNVSTIDDDNLIN